MTGTCGHCGAPFERKVKGKWQRYCSSRCFHRAYRRRRAGRPESDPVMSRTANGQGSISVQHRPSGRVSYRVRFKIGGVRYNVYTGPDKRRAQAVQAEIAQGIADGSWSPPARRKRESKGHGSVNVERKKHGLLFYLAFKRGNTTHYVSLGRSADGWTRELAEAERERISDEIDAGTWRPPLSEKVDPLAYAQRKCRDVVEELDRAIAVFERRTGKEAPPHLGMIRETAKTLSLSGAANKTVAT